MLDIYCPECFGDPLECGKSPWQLIEVKRKRNCYECPECGTKFELSEFEERWRYIEEEIRLEEECQRQTQELIDQGIIDDPDEDDYDEIVDEFGRPY